MDALRSVLNNRDSNPGVDEEQGILSGLSEATTMSRTTRLKLFVTFFAVGILFSILGSVCLFFGFTKGLAAFAAFYTLGNLASIGSTMFLVGPVRQMKNMFDSKRLIATIVMISTLVLTLIAAFVVKSSLLALMMVIIQSLAMTWYAISYIPYARDVVIGFFKSIL